MKSTQQLRTGPQHLLHAVSRMLMVLCGFGLAAGVATYWLDTRFSRPVYIFFVGIQVGAIIVHLLRRNLMTAVFSLPLTAMLFMATAIETVPRSDFSGFLEPSVYRSEIVATAYAVLLSVGCLYHLVAIAFIPASEWHWGAAGGAEREFARSATLFFLIVGTVLLALTVNGGSITDATYVSARQQAEAGALSTSSGLALIAVYFMSCALVAASRTWGYSSDQYRLVLGIVLVATVYFRLMRGDRGNCLGVFCTMAFLFFLNSRLSARGKAIALGGGIMLLGIVFQVWPYVRLSAADIGLWRSMAEGVQDMSAAGFQPLRVDLLPQSYWHLLHTIDLYQMGFALHGRSFLYLIPQSVPQFITDFFGYVRPDSGPVLLMNYRPHGGGLFVIGEGFWNFGLAGSLMIAGALAFVAAKLEAWFRKKEPLIACTYFAFLGTFAYGMFYGLQTLVKGLEIALIMTMVFASVMKAYRARYENRERARQLFLQLAVERARRSQPATRPAGTVAEQGLK